MSNHPLNLLLLFLLELSVLAAMGYWGWAQGQGWPQYLWAIGTPLVAATLWGVFRIPNDPGPATVAVPGALRLVLELAFFSFATWALYNAGQDRMAMAMGIILILHYAISYDRIRWMLTQ